MDISEAILNRATLLLGDENMQRLSERKVIIFGVGGVGSWTAESLIRSGIMHLTIVDSDRVCVTNVNRQAMATTTTIGRVKVDAMKERLLAINPNAQIVAIQDIYTAETANNYDLSQYDVVVDAIDSLKDKALLILNACKTKAFFVSSMGAALKMDPTKVQVAEFWKVKGCPLGHALRKKFKYNRTLPSRKFPCVYSEEVLPNLGEARTCGTSACMCPKNKVGAGRADLENHEWCSSKAQINGSLMHITAIFGLTIAGLILQKLTAQE
ncbi:MAG: tRNA threonylcarbamoyladenosine dehydratase [Marinilabiliaceae bacterium]|jgi:tRNA A37 threonylcarbamoyladenosine dehydratase|nr:tRNA threonylcarbamoyladenosine dehydratase [Marinilabiliaceae bacterium]